MKLRVLTTLGICLSLGLVVLPGQAADYTPTATADLAISSKGFPRMAFDPTGTRLAVSLRKSADKGKVVFLNVPDLAVIREVLMDGEPLSLSYSRQGDFFALALAPGGGQNLVVVSTTDWKPVYADREIQPNISSIVFDPVGDYLLTGHEAPAAIGRFVVGSWSKEKIPALEGAEVPCTSLAVSLDGRFTAAGLASARLAVWLNDDSKPVSMLGSQQFKASVNAVAFSRDSSLLAAGDSAGNVMVFYQTPDGLWAWKTVFTLPSGGVTGVGFLNDLSLATSSSDGVIARWDLANTSQPIEAVNVAPSDSQTFAIDPRGKWMAVGGEKISIFPLGSPVPEPVTDMPSAPFTIAETNAPDKAPPVPAVASIDTTSDAPIPEPVSEDHGNFLFWLALGSPGDDGQDWIQAWAGQIDDGRFSPLQLVLPYDTLNTGVMKSNLGNIGKVLKPRDFSVFYAAAVICPTTEKDKGDFPLAFGANLEQRINLSEVLRGLQAAAGVAPSVWFLDLRPHPKLTDEQTDAIFGKIAVKVIRNDDGTRRTPLGPGLLVLAKDGAYPELSAGVSDGLSGQADTDNDGKVMDLEIVKYLSERCRTATRLQLVGDAKDPIPVLPAFNLKRN